MPTVPTSDRRKFKVMLPNRRFPVPIEDNRIVYDGKYQSRWRTWGDEDVLPFNPDYPDTFEDLP